MSGHAAAQAAAREDLCRFLAACYCEPTAAFGEERLFESMLAAATVIHPDLVGPARKLGEQFAAQELQELLVDYTALFIGPAQPRAMPYASFWLTDDQSMRHEATMAVLDFYAEGGFDVSEEIHELPDHVAVELEFLYALNFACHHADPGGNTDARAAAEALRRRFVGEHLGRWIGRFAKAVDAGAQTAFYRELAALTLGFVGLEAGLPARNGSLAAKSGLA